MSPRITINLTDKGTLEIWLNEMGRDLLVEALQNLSARKEHFHLGPTGIGEVEVCSRPYRPSDQIIKYGKVLFRTDEWDRQYFPHVFGPDSQKNSK